MQGAIWLYGHVAGKLPRWVVRGVYATPWLARLIRAALGGVIPVEMQEVEVVAGPLAGVRLPIYPRNEVSFVSGLWEFWVQDALLSCLQPGDEAWDVGAYIGYFTLVMRLRCGPGRVVAVEPDPQNRGRLEATLAMNGIDDIAIVPSAVGLQEGTARLDRQEGHPAAVHAGGSGETVTMTTLDALLAEHPSPSLIKLDVEGAEADVLRGSPRMLREIRPIWLLEVHGDPGWEAVRLLGDAGYRIHHLNPRESRTHQVHILARPSLQ